MPNLGAVREKTRAGLDHLPIPTRSKPSRRRVILRRAGLGESGLIGLGVLGLGARWAYANRYREGFSEILTATAMNDGRAVICLTDGTVLVISAANWHLVSGDAKVGAGADYRVNRWSIGGIPAGEIYSATNEATNEPGTF